MASLILGAPPRVTVALSSSRLSSSQSETFNVSLSCFTQQFSLSTSSSSSIPLVYCGRGDRKTAKGKRFNHSFGNARPRNKSKGRGPLRTTRRSKSTLTSLSSLIRNMRFFTSCLIVILICFRKL